MAVAEAKRKGRAVMGSSEQAARYSPGFRLGVTPGLDASQGL
ncbi:hypothetical protein [Deinococcus aestuarii]|nr:hypothetical protein [Deinococcus aestuarii]